MSENHTAHYMLRYMHMDDIPQVVEIDRLSFPMPWSARSYAFEIQENNAGHMIVLEVLPDAQGGNGLNGILQRLRGRYTHSATIAGYGGFWLIEGEVHISTIAVHPDFRGQGLGDLLLAGMLERGMALNAEYSVLEVRVSNQPAVSLYQKYGYETVGQRKNYYRDNNEDAYLMHLAPLDDAFKARFAERLEDLHRRVPYTDLLVQPDK